MHRTARAACLLLGLSLAGGAFAQEPAVPEAVQKELREVQELLVRAIAEFDGAQQSRSISIFDEIIRRLERLRAERTLPARGREILIQAYELRGRAYFNIGVKEKAAESFAALVQIRPQHAMSRERVSPKVVDYFDSVKKALVGYLAVSSRPPGARVSLDGEFLSLTDFFPVEVVAGEYTVEIAREGYGTDTRTVSIAPGVTETLEVDLARTAASLFVVTQPMGVEIWVDGALKATSGGSLAPELVALARDKGLDPAGSSGRTEVAGLSLGTHVIEFRRKCHDTVRKTMEIAEAKDYDTEAVRLEEALASLELRSDPGGATILLDGEPMGTTPRALERVCAGRHLLEVRHTSGRFVQELLLEKGQRLSLDCPIRPSLAFLGVAAASAAGERTAAEAEEQVVRGLAKTTAFNVLPAPRETVARALGLERIGLAELVSGAPSDAVRRVTERLAADLDVQGFLVALLPEERLQRSAVVHLLAAGNTISEHSTLMLGENASYERFLAALARRPAIQRPWLGLVTVDTLLYEGVPVLRVASGSPAEKAGIRIGEVVQSAGGNPVRQTSDLMEAVRSRRPGDRIALQLGGATARTVEVTVGQTPEEVPLNEPSLLYNAVMVDLRQRADGRPGTEAAAMARLNLALCAMHFGDFAGAHEHLMKAKDELPQRPGISQGTALYYLGLALERLGYRKEAMDAYRAAAAAKDATLLDNDGPAVAPLAQARVGP